MDDVSEEIEKVILRIKRKFEEGIKQEKKLKYLNQLDHLPINLQILKKTSIGKIVNTLRKEDGTIAENAQKLVLKWKNMAASEKNSPVKNIHMSQSNHAISKQKISKDNPHHSHSNHSKHRTSFEINSYEDSNHRQSLNKEIDHSNSQKDELVDSTCSDGDQSSFNHKVSFGDMLMMPVVETKKKKKKLNTLKLNKDKILIPTLPDIVLPDFTPEPVYRPSRPIVRPDDGSLKRKRQGPSQTLTDISSRKTRSAMYSGKRNTNGVVISLYQQSMRILIENIDSLYETGGVPYSLLEPLLTKCSPAQLERLEIYNPHFLEESDALWKIHCQREFKSQKLNEQNGEEEWRDIYKKLNHEREERLSRLSSKITAAQAAKLPERSAKLAYVAGSPKPSAQMLRKQKRHGTGFDSIAEKKKELRERIDNDQRNSAISIVPFSKVPRRDRCAVRPPSSLNSSNHLDIKSSNKRGVQELGSGPSSFSSHQPRKPAKKPMMAAALKLLKKQKGRMTSAVIRK